MVEPGPPDIYGPWPYFLTSILPSDAHLSTVSLLLEVITRIFVNVILNRFNITYLSLLSPYSNMYVLMDRTSACTASSVFSSPC
jgi:hypothetical protein